MAEELRASLARVVAAADDERRRIERELHDGVQQHLVALAVNAQLVREIAESDPPEALRLMEDVARDAREALEAVRALAARIYPPLLLDRGLAEALRAAATACKVPARAEVDGLGRYPIEVEAVAYFCCVEALEAVAACAERVKLRAWQEGGELRLEVGAAAEPLPRLVGAADRLAALGGRLDVEGGRVTAIIPLAT
jgi:signal transduction histidine kinase